MIRLALTFIGLAVASSLSVNCGSSEAGSDVGNATDKRPQAGQLDRMGHVEVGPLIIADMAVADRYNREEPFALNLSQEARAEYGLAFQKGLIKFDHYDSYELKAGDLSLDALKLLGDKRAKEAPSADLLDWYEDTNNPHPLSEIYMTDALFVDVSLPCNDRGYRKDAEGNYTEQYRGGYLEPEMATLAGELYKTCGGRMPNEDVIDRLATLLINGPKVRETTDPEARYPNRGDSVTEPYKPASRGFPYLSRPYSGFEEGKI